MKRTLLTHCKMGGCKMKDSCECIFLFEVVNLVTINYEYKRRNIFTAKLDR